MSRRTTRSQAPVEDMAKKNSSFSTNVVYKDIERVKQLLKEGVDPSYDNNNAIRIANLPSNPLSKTADPRNVELLKLLLADDRVDPSVDDNISLFHAATRNDIESMKVLINDKRFRITPMIAKLSKNPKLNPEALEIIQRLLNKQRIEKVQLDKSKIGELSRLNLPPEVLKNISEQADISYVPKGIDPTNPRGNGGKRKKTRRTRKNGKTRRR